MRLRALIRYDGRSFSEASCALCSPVDLSIHGAPIGPYERPIDLALLLRVNADTKQASERRHARARAGLEATGKKTGSAGGHLLGNPRQHTCNKPSSAAISRTAQTTPMTRRAAGISTNLDFKATYAWRLRCEFQAWVARVRTLMERIAVIRELLGTRRTTRFRPIR